MKNGGRKTRQTLPAVDLKLPDLRAGQSQESRLTSGRQKTAVTYKVARTEKATPGQAW